ncbi:hypothetical protein HZA43_00230 [Candidatus Peregrinibacteria bacterium]|nr:hypothetical protein [Candidatus Peregrinibacteria bacterium]
MAYLFATNNRALVSKKTLSERVEASISSLVFVIITLICLLSLAYLAHANQNATRGYALRNLELKQSNLAIQNEVWDMQIAKAQSLEIIQKDPKILSMIKADKPLFIRMDTAIVKK